jgi:hypothetical protein
MDFMLSVPWDLGAGEIDGGVISGTFEFYFGKAYSALIQLNLGSTFEVAPPFPIPPEHLSSAAFCQITSVTSNGIVEQLGAAFSDPRPPGPISIARNELTQFSFSILTKYCWAQGTVNVFVWPAVREMSFPIEGQTGHYQLGSNS